MTALSLGSWDVAEEAASAERTRPRELSARQDRVITFAYRAVRWCETHTDAAEQRTRAVFQAAPELLSDPDLDDPGYRARFVTTLLPALRTRQHRTAIVHAAYLDQRDTAGPAPAHVWELLVRALSDGDPPARAIAAVTARTGVAATLVREQFVALVRAVAEFTAHLPADIATACRPQR